MSGPDLMSIVGAGTSLLVGTVSPDGEPRATRSWSASVVDDALLRLRILMSADDDVAVANLATGVIAITGADVRTLRSAQLKGRVVVTGPPSADDLESLTRHAESFFLAVNEVDGFSTPVLRRMLPHRVIAVEVVVEDVFDQSPGPAAGSNMGVAP